VGGGDKDSRKIYGTKFTVGWDFKMPKLKHQALICSFTKNPKATGVF
jgi:hypothetical protein